MNNGSLKNISTSNNTEAPRILIVGATSGMAQAWARLKAEQKAKMVLVGRNAEKLKTLKQDLLVRGAQQVEVVIADLAQLDLLEETLQKAQQHLPVWDLALIAQGTLPPQALCEKDAQLMTLAIHENFISPALCAQSISQKMPAHQGCTIVVITSVAADRGRQSNFVYGSAKAGLSTYLSGLRNCLYPQGVRVLEIKPGFVDTPMTAHLPKNALFATPQDIALGIEKALKRDDTSVYLPWFWQWIMLIIKSIPEFIFMRLKL